MPQAPSLVPIPFAPLRVSLVDLINTTMRSCKPRAPSNDRLTPSSVRLSRGSSNTARCGSLSGCTCSIPTRPTTPPAPFAAAHTDTPYDGEVAYTDAAIGRLFEWLKARDLFSLSTIIIVADHGESLGEHGERTHGTFLYDATVRVPLMVKLPRAVNAGVVDVPVETAGSGTDNRSAGWRRAPAG